MIFIFLSLLMGLVTFAAPMARADMQAVVIVPVADVWNRPLATGEIPSDDLRETQVLLGEKVLLHESSGPWVRIEAVEQPTFRQHNRWEGYPGWIKGSTVEKKSWPPPPVCLAGGTNIVNVAESFLGAPYVWGGLSSHISPVSLKSTLARNGCSELSPVTGPSSSRTGLDCSGLIHLSYRLNGWVEIPRDAHEQWMKATPIKRADKPADLIFSAQASNPKTITHVALYAGEGQIIEAPQTGMVVRKISFKEKYGRDLADVESGQTVGDRVIYFGRFIP